MSTQMTHGFGVRLVVAASPEAVGPVWHPNALADAQPLRWRADIQHAPSSHEAVARRARRARHRARETSADVGEAESHSPAPHMAHQSCRRNRIVVDVGGSFQDGSIIDLTSTGTQLVPNSDGEE